MNLDASLEAAVTHHFLTLFDVLMTDPTDAGLERFERGLKNLIRMHVEVQAVIAKQPS
jgi:hypothetical protein